MIKIRTPSRIHITLIDLNGALGRVDGGIGITLDRPSFILSAEEADEVIVEGDSALCERVRMSAEMIAGRDRGARITIEEDIPSHVGLGSGTQASLAAGMAVNLLYDLGLSVREMAKMVRRGGTSGIGVAAFEGGGFILDGGHKFKGKGFKPSAVSHAPPPPVLIHHDFPDWDIVLAIPGLQGASGASEVDIFQRECPIPLSDVQAVSHVILMELLPALFEEDLMTFGSAINRIQDIGFKRREIELQPIAREIMDVMLQNGAAGAGMSSFGPLVYGIADQPSGLRDAVEEYLKTSIGGDVMTVRARNTGASIKFI